MWFWLGWSDSNLSKTSKDIEYSLISGMSSPTVEGHNGILSSSDLNEKQVLVFQGRRHLYEGEGWDPISFPIHLAYALGIKDSAY